MVKIYSLQKISLPLLDEIYHEQSYVSIESLPQDVGRGIDNY
jgi:hypothetical protein